jgi:hypothetical protein
MERLIEKRAQAMPSPATLQQADQGLSQAEQDYRQAMQHYEAIEEAALELADDRLLKVFRGTAIAWFAAVGSKHATDEIRAAALAASRDIDALSLDMRLSVPAHNAAITVVADTARTRTSTLHLDPAGRYAAKAGDPSFWASSATTTGLADDLDWFDWCESGPALTARPLWPAGAAPEDWVLRSQRLRTALLTIDPSWEVWTKWYDDRARGVPFDVEIERKRVLPPAEVWRQPPASVNTYIAQILK